MNGARDKHISKSYYRKSRGLILLELAASKDFEEDWKQIDLIDIEPFTIVTYRNGLLLRLIWDGEKRLDESLSLYEPQIWSSATLYSPDVAELRKSWFNEFYQGRVLSPKDLFDFHTKTKVEDPEIGLIINRDDKIRTNSVTQFVLSKNKFELSYLDILQNTSQKITESIL
ncbi:MAG: hypothetical protein R2809_14735 [Flavobacteriales bacterium]